MKAFGRSKGSSFAHATITAILTAPPCFLAKARRGIALKSHHETVKKPSRPLRLSPIPQKGYAIIDMSGLMGQIATARPPMRIWHRHTNSFDITAETTVE